MKFIGQGLPDVSMFYEWSGVSGQDWSYDTGLKTYTGYIPKNGYNKIVVTGTGGTYQSSYLDISSIKLYKEKN